MLLNVFEKIVQYSITLCTQSLNSTEAPGCSPTRLRAFKWYPKHCEGSCGLGNLNMTNIKDFSNGIKSIARAVLGWESSTWQISRAFQMVPKALQGLLWVGNAQHDKRQGLSNARPIVGWESSTWQTSRALQWYHKHCKGYCGLGKLNMTNIKGFPMVPTKSMARAIVVWEISTWQTNKTNQQPSVIESYSSFYSLKGSRLQRLNPSFGMYLNLILQYLGEEILLDASIFSCSTFF